MPGSPGRALLVNTRPQPPAKAGIINTCVSPVGLEYGSRQRTRSSDTVSYYHPSGGHLLNRASTSSLTVATNSRYQYMTWCGRLTPLNLSACCGYRVIWQRGHLKGDKSMTSRHVTLLPADTPTGRSCLKIGRALFYHRTSHAR